MRRLWRRSRAIALMGRHERWRVALGCPGVPHPRGLQRDAIEPRRGEVYCRCARCNAARELVGWEQLR